MLKKRLGIKEFLNRKIIYQIIREIISETGVCELENYIKNTGFEDVEIESQIMAECLKALRTKASRLRAGQN